MTESISPDSLITLHYRLTNQDGVEIISTFGSTPATLQLGAGELAPTLEQCVLQMNLGEERSFQLDASAAYGAHNPQLVQRLGRKDLPADAQLEIDATVQFTAPNGARFAGRVRQFDAESALIDFNHPLAGQSVRFDVQLIGTL
jgi:FKBP-type peptidyl-prolyl cis-trans isomerase SlpA